MTVVPPPASPPLGVDQQLLTDAILKIGQLCDLLSRNSALVGTSQPIPVPAVVASAKGTAVGASTAAAVSLGAFLSTVDDLTLTQRDQVLDAALAMIDQVYVHLPLKRAMHAIEPIQRLRLLRQRHRELSVRTFHDEMIRIFHSLRDLHTNYILPTAYQGKTAFLPFQVEEYFSGVPQSRQYVVTRLIAGFAPPAGFAPGVQVTHWNGIPFDHAVELNAEREAGSNLDARLARGLESLTIRPMALTAPPYEEWVIVRYIDANNNAQEWRFDWQVFEPPPPPTGINLTATDMSTAYFLGVDARTEAVRRARKALFAPEAVKHELVMAGVTSQAGILAMPPTAAVPPAEAALLGLGAATQGVDYQTESIRRSRKALFAPEAMALEQRMSDALAAAGALATAGVVGAAAVGGPQPQTLMPDVFSFKTVPDPQGNLGYIRIRTFMVNDADAFVAEFVRITRLLPKNGLIIDVRGNGGGNILAGERLLQVLTPQPIEGERFHFINSSTTLELCKTASPAFDLQRWVPSIELAIETGETYSQGWPLGTADDYNRVGQQYQGPVVLVIDALCYSTTDIFSAGFQDHKIGKILGIHQHTGAGGANVWEYGLLRSILPNQFKQLPGGATFRVAIRRTTRVKERAGVPVEDLGVVPDARHYMTRNDVLNGNPDLIAAAAQLFVGVPVRELSGTLDRTQPAALRVRVQAKNVSRVDAYLNGRPLATGDVAGGTVTLTLGQLPVGSGRLRLCGFDADELVVVGWVDL